MVVFENRDCLEAMKETPDKFFDLAIVDPPYGDGGGVYPKRFGGMFQSSINGTNTRAKVGTLRRKVCEIQATAGDVEFRGGGYHGKYQHGNIPFLSTPSAEIGGGGGYTEPSTAVGTDMTTEGIRRAQSVKKS